MTRNMKKTHENMTDYPFSFKIEYINVIFFVVTVIYFQPFSIKNNSIVLRNVNMNYTYQSIYNSDLSFSQRTRNLILK